MNTVKPLFALALLVILYGCSQPADNGSTQIPEAATTEADRTASRISDMQGTWIHTEDSLSVVEITDNQWSFRYAEAPAGASDIYDITLAETMAPFIDKNVTSSFMILSNATDTMRYEIEGLSEEYMTLLYYPREITHTYRRTK